MFWRKQKAALAEFPPLHQALVHDRALSAAQPAHAWAALAASLGRHGQQVTRSKWALPQRTLDVMVPLILEICSDLGPDGVLSVTADLRGPKAPGKTYPARDLPVRPPVRSATETWTVDPWLRLNAGLRDGSTLEILVVDRERSRRITRRNPRGKIKTKRKSKRVQIIKVRRRLPKDGTSVRPATAPPQWIAVAIRSGERPTVLASAKLDPPPRTSQELLDRILTVATEPFRWTPLTSAGGGIR